MKYGESAFDIFYLMTAIIVGILNFKRKIYMSECRNWYNGDPVLEEYHDHEWCKVNHDDDFQFQMLCLEGASVGLSWQIIIVLSARLAQLWLAAHRLSASCIL